MAKIIKTWHDENTIASQYYVNENGVRNGDSRTWDVNGVLETQCNYVDGKIIGTKKFYRKDGTIEREIDYDFDGSPFVVKFFMDDWIKVAQDLGLSPAVEHVTLESIVESFSKLKTSHDALLEQKTKEETIEKEIAKIRTTKNNMPKVTFT